METMKSVRRLAWSIWWKAAILGLPFGYALGFAFGFIVSFVGALAGLPQENLLLISRIGGFVLGTAVNFLLFNFFLARAIGKQIGDRRLEFVETTAFEERN